MPLQPLEHGLCGVNASSTPLTRQGLWYFGLAGGLPLHGSRYFGAAPAQLRFEALVELVPAPLGNCCLDQGREGAVAVTQPTAPLTAGASAAITAAQPAHALHWANSTSPLSYVGVAALADGESFTGNLYFSVISNGTAATGSLHVCAAQGQAALPSHASCEMVILNGTGVTVDAVLPLSGNNGTGPWHISAILLNDDAALEDVVSLLEVPDAEWVNASDRERDTWPSCVCDVGTDSGYSLQMAAVGAPECELGWAHAAYGAVAGNACTQRVRTTSEIAAGGAERAFIGDMAVLAPFLSQQTPDANAQESECHSELWHNISAETSLVQWQGPVSAAGDGPIGAEIEVRLLVYSYNASQAAETAVNGHWNMGVAGGCDLPDIPLNMSMSVTIDLAGGAAETLQLNTADADYVKFADSDEGSIGSYQWFAQPPPLAGTVLTITVALSSNATATFPQDGAVMVQPMVSFTRCSSQACPQSKGSCSVSMGTAEGVLVGTCYCKYGWGGEGCADRLVSTQTIALQAAALVLTNLAVVPSVVLAYRLRKVTDSAAGPGAVFGVAGASSALYHLCDIGVACIGGLRYGALQSLDILFSYMSSAAVATYLAYWPPGTSYLVPALYTVVFSLFMLASVDGPVQATNVIIGFIIVGTLLVLSWGVQIVRKATALKVASSAQTVPSTWMHCLRNAVVAVLVTPGHFDTRMLACGVALLVAAMVTFALQGNVHYALTHSCWHVLSLASTYFFLRARQWHGSDGSQLMPNGVDANPTQCLFDVEEDRADEG
eukprot:TRINITY_DN14455_c0_g1_i2.p1 TRINITY_DN14455_c0_g1~~TRINITY_DN14455_c0_g1_i2.p1  ORF type:complete len:900 (+),score=132.52 TRINITY_DN14455_c0_g1_i2:369-2702(+)